MKNISLIELKNYFVNNEASSIHQTIDFSKYYFFMKIFFNAQFDYVPEDSEVKKIFNYYNKFIKESTQSPNLESLQDISKIVNKDLFGTGYYNVIKKNMLEGDKNLVIIECPCSRNIKKFPIFLKTKFLIFPHTDTTDKSYKDFLNNLDDEGVREYSYDYVKNIRDIFQVDNEKQDNIIIKLSVFNSFFLPYSISQIKFPELLTTVVYALTKLKKGGYLMLSLTQTNLNPAYEKLFTLLTNHFDTYYHKYDIFKKNLILGGLLIFKGYKDNIDSSLIRKLKNISMECLDYNYKIYDYYLYMEKNKEINYKFKDFDIKTPVKKLMIIDDIDINPKETKSSKLLLDDVEDYFYSQINLLNSYITRNIKEKNGKLTVDIDFFKKLLYLKAVIRIYSLNRLKLSVNKSLFAFINKFNNDIIDRLFSYKTSAFNLSHEINNTIKSKSKYNLTNFVVYTFNNFYTQLQLLADEQEIRKNEMINLKYDKSKNLLYVFEEFKIQLPKYLKTKFNLPGNITSTFCKFWEIYQIFPFLIRDKKKLTLFNFGNNSEEVNYSTRYKLKLSKKKIEYDLYSDSISNKINYIDSIKKYDTYQGLLNIENLLKEVNLDLITCEEVSESENLTKIQKIEFGKLMTVLLSSKKGTNCAIRHLLPFQENIKNSLNYPGFFVNLLYIYIIHFDKVYLYKPVSTSTVRPEFYVIGKGFKGNLENMEREILLNVMKYFKKNACVYTQSSLDSNIIEQIYEFTKKLYDDVYKNIETETILLSCINEKYPDVQKEIGCEKVFDQKYQKIYQVEKFQDWVNKFKFE